ncbi:unnamed protein product [Commensalibacter communis]|uniref:Secreted protein n=1 Tax=Commensalibacter communis TaxID=2972786 RepID=A0A9W4XI14_9PROT|nr:hypothetical protein [Commensalibacter communis]CAI3922734.1 unnamed protein product [Commensalibacter communis]CAI3934747.1 unnamed protein product [Commensalibacter communis]CAI3944392.1 unnamed protein product [Commensalibacter communis]CAI3945829.1 unnamed protein product [Commensalibacter communis]CAI3945897.1 unnamed protein product [Commensalibacter communis]
MRKYIISALSLLLVPSLSLAQGKNNAVQQITKQRDIADYNCKNNLPNQRAAIGFCKKRDGLQKKLDNMNNGYNNNQNQRNHNSHNHRDHHNNQDRHNH